VVLLCSDCNRDFLKLFFPCFHYFFSPSESTCKIFLKIDLSPFVPYDGDSSSDRLWFHPLRTGYLFNLYFLTANSVGTSTFCCAASINFHWFTVMPGSTFPPIKQYGLSHYFIKLYRLFYFVAFPSNVSSDGCARARTRARAHTHTHTHIYRKTANFTSRSRECWSPMFWARYLRLFTCSSVLTSIWIFDLTGSFPWELRFSFCLLF
jgi:hypothetical protein